jgi:hypothetical protein
MYHGNTWWMMSMSIRQTGLGVLVVVIISELVQHFGFGTTFADGIGPAVAAAGGYLILVFILRRRHVRRNA